VLGQADAGPDDLGLAARLLAGLCWQRSHADALEAAAAAAVTAQLGRLLGAASAAVRVAAVDAAAALAGTSVALCDAVAQPVAVRGLVLALSDPACGDRVCLPLVPSLSLSLYRVADGCA
jgi:hypothetical protein